MALNEGQFKKYGTSLPRSNKPRTMSQWNDRANVLAAAKAGSIKEAPKGDTEKVFKVNRPMTKLFVGKGGGALVGKDVTVKSGSKKAARLKAREATYQKNYGTLAPYKKGK